MGMMNQSNTKGGDMSDTELLEVINSLPIGTQACIFQAAIELDDAGDMRARLEAAYAELTYEATEEEQG
jgi:hypothetical protein